jgi:hypothetical protein
MLAGHDKHDPWARLINCLPKLWSRPGPQRGRTFPVSSELRSTGSSTLFKRMPTSALTPQGYAETDRHIAAHRLSLRKPPVLGIECDDHEGGSESKIFEPGVFT